MTSVRAAALPPQSDPGGRYRKGGEAPLRGLKWRGKVGLAHEVEVHPASARAALGDGPYDQGLPALHVAAGEDAGRARHPGPIAPDVAPVGELEAQLIDRAPALRTEEAHREQHEIDGERELAAGDGAKVQASTLADHVDLHGLERLDATALVADQALGGDRVHTLAALLVRRGDAEDVRPLGPGVVGRAHVGWPRQQLELVNGACALSVDGSQAVGAGVTPADDHDVLVLRGDEPLVRNHVALAALVLQRQVVHREVDAGELAAGHGQIARLARAARKHHRVEVLAKVADGRARADVRIGLEDDAGLLHETQAPIHEPLLHLELGNPVAQEAPDAVGALEDDHPVPGAVELVRGGETRGPRADDGHALAGPGGGWLWGDPAVLERVLDDGDLDRLDRHGVVVDAEHARAFTRRRTQAARPLREVVGGVQPVDGLAPAVAVHEVVPVRNDVAERAALVAEGDTAVHAARRLLLEILVRVRKVDFLPVADPVGHGPRGPLLARDLEEAGDLAHGATRW